MSTATIAPATATPEREALTARFVGGAVRFARWSPLTMVASIMLIVPIVLAILAPWIAPYDPTLNQYQKLVQEPSAEHIMGTDKLGRDVFSRLLYGTRISLFVAFTAVMLGEALGFILGIMTAYTGGRFDLVSQRLVDVLMSFPTLILAMLLMAGLGAGIATVIIAIAVTRVPGSSRIIRSVALSIKELNYVEAARVMGASHWRIMLRHIAPQCIAPLLVVFSLNLGAAIFAEAALSYLGVGVPPPTPSLGNMLGEQNAQSFKPPWWLVVFPGLAITEIILAANLVGDGMRDFFDPRLKGRGTSR
jgi:ABC-type dipeptide/oligopeptide/nickel transport system permease subunit